ncbi:MAG TPA: hypothetical protein G4N93_06890 [Dehalococcoidia bacterium]|nr:hypothetical protein [Dehalococcoidia bacterium]
MYGHRERSEAISTAPTFVSARSEQQGILWPGAPLLHDVEEDDGSTADCECAGDAPDNDRVFPGFVLQRARE